MCWKMEASGQARSPSSSSERLRARSVPILSRCEAELKRNGLRAFLTGGSDVAAVTMGSPRGMRSNRWEYSNLAWMSEAFELLSEPAKLKVFLLFCFHRFSCTREYGLQAGEASSSGM